MHAVVASLAMALLPRSLCEVFSDFVATHDFCTTTKAPATYTRYHCYAPDSISTLKEVQCIDMLLSTFWTMCQIIFCLIPQFAN
jgi:hypothetical protein